MRCYFCEKEQKSEKLRFCSDCSLYIEHFDPSQEENGSVDAFRETVLTILSDEPTYDFWGTRSDSELRRSYNISYETAKSVVDSAQKRFKGHLQFSSCSLEFDANVTNAYANADTLLRFRFTNNSNFIVQSVILTWDDKRSSDELDFKAFSSGLIKQGQSTLVEGTHIFDLAGTKTIGGHSNDLIVQIKAINQTPVKFKSSTFILSIASPTQVVHNTISNTTSINVEAERVVGTFDASKAVKVGENSAEKGPVSKWQSLTLTPLLDVSNKEEEKVGLVAPPPAKAVVAEQEKARTVPPAAAGGYDSTASTETKASTSESSPSKTSSSSQSLPSELPSHASPRDGVEHFVDCLALLSTECPLHQEKSIIKPVDFSIGLTQQLLSIDKRLTNEDLLGFLLLQPETAYLDEHSYVEGFDGGVVLFTQKGTFTAQNGLYSDLYNFCSWKDWTDQGYAPQIRRFSKTQFLIYFGNKTGTMEQGLTFDFRRYQGSMNVEEVFQRLLRSYSLFQRETFSNNSVSDLDQDETSDFNDDSESVDEAPPAYLIGQDYQYTSNQQTVEDLLKVLGHLNARSNEFASKVCLKQSLTEEFLQEIYLNVPDCDSTDEIIGVVFNEYDDLAFVDDDTVATTAGLAAVFFDWGIDLRFFDGDGYPLSGPCEEIGESLYWSTFASQAIQLYRFGEPGSYSLAFSRPNNSQIPPVRFDFSNIDIEEQDDYNVSISDLWNEAWKLIVILHENNRVDEEEIDDSQLDDEPVETNYEAESTDLGQGSTENDVSDDSDSDQALIDGAKKRVDEIREAGRRLFSVLSFALQQCSDRKPKPLFLTDECTDEHLTALYEATVRSGTGPIAIALDPEKVELTIEGKLSGWSGEASVLSVEGVFHCARDASGTYVLDGKNSFLSWRKFFNDYRGAVHIRELGPDLWFGVDDKVLIRSGYCDYSNNVLQWDYFEDFIKEELLSSLSEFKGFFTP